MVMMMNKGVMIFISSLCSVVEKQDEVRREKRVSEMDFTSESTRNNPLSSLEQKYSY